jgi:predicted transcriptional regulator
MIPAAHPKHRSTRAEVEAAAGRVLDFIAQRPGRRNTEIACALGITQARAAYYVRVLKQAGKVRVSFARRGNMNRVYLAPAESGVDEDDE